MADLLSLGGSALASVPDPTTYINSQIQAGQAQALNAQTIQQQQIATQQAQNNYSLQQRQQAQVQQAWQNYQQDPTAPGALEALGALAPELYKGIQEVHTGKTADEQRQDLMSYSGIQGQASAALDPDANRADADDASAAVVNQLQNRVTADLQAKRPSSADQALLDMARSGNIKGVLAASQVMLRGALGPDKYAAAYGAQSTADKDAAATALAQAKLPSEIAKNQADAAQANATAQNTLHPHPETAVGGNDPDTGQPLYYDKNAPPPVNGAGGAAGTPTDLQTFATKMQASENGTGNPAAKNPRSSATGNGQFLNGTWVHVMAATRPDLTGGATEAQINAGPALKAKVLAMRSDPAIANQATVAYAQQNAASLSGAGLPVTGASLAASHRLGVAGAAAVMHAPQDAPLTSVLPPAVIAANPDLKTMTVRSFASSLQGYGTTALNTAPPDPNATGPDYLKTLPPQRAALIQSIIDGNTSLDVASTRNGGKALLASQVLRADPTASEINLNTRTNTRRDFTSGQAAQTITSLNTVVGHLVGLDHAIDQLNNVSAPWANAANQFLNSATGQQGPQKAVAQFNFYKTAVANELTKVFRGSGGSEADIQGWMSQMKSDESPAALHQTVQSMVGGMQSRLESLGAQYSQGMGRVSDPLQLLSPHARAMLQTLSATPSSSPQSAPSPQAVATLKANPRTAAQFDSHFGPGASTRYLGGS